MMLIERARGELERWKWDRRSSAEFGERERYSIMGIRALEMDVGG